MADDTPNTTPPTPPSSGNPPPAAGKPPVIGVRPITVRPVTPAAPAPATPPAGTNGVKPATVHLKQTAPRPPTTPVGVPTVAVPAVTPPAAVAPAPGAGPSTIRLKPTAVRPPAATPPAPDSAASSPAARSGVSPATIRLKPVVPPSGAPRPAAPTDAEIAPTIRVKPVIAGQPAVSSAPKPGSAPLPPGPKPLKPEQIQAAKAKTSRISLDAALIGGQEDRGGPKTIRLKRPSDAPVGKITSHLGAASDAATGQQPPRSRQSSPLIPPIPSSPSNPVVNRYTTSIEVPDADEIAIRRSGPMQTPDSNAPLQDTTGAEESSITRRKTIRVRRPGGATPSPSSTMPTSPTPAGKDDADKTGELVLHAEDFGPVARTHWFFSVVAIASLFILIALLVVQLSQDSKLFEINAWPPNTPAVKLPGMVPIPGRG